MPLLVLGDLEEVHVDGAVVVVEPRPHLPVREDDPGAAINLVKTAHPVGAVGFQLRPRPPPLDQNVRRRREFPVRISHDPVLLHPLRIPGGFGQQDTK